LRSLTGRRPETRNRVEFFFPSPIYDGFYRPTYAPGRSPRWRACR